MFDAMPVQFAKWFRLSAALVSAAILASPPADAKSAAPIPDLSGQWGRDMNGFEAPLSGSGPIVFKRKTDGTVDLSAPIGDVTNPILKRGAAEVLKKQNGIVLSGLAFPSLHNQCWSEPPPFGVVVQFGVQLLQQRNEITLIYLADHNVRHVRLNVPHPAHVIPTWQGDSVGLYEGDTLVIDTIGIKVGPLSSVDLFGTPHSEALHVIERYRLIDGEAASTAQRKHLGDYIDPNGNTSLLAFEFLSPIYGRGPIDQDTKKKGLQVEIIVNDPGVFTTPWSALVTYRPVTGDWPETVCAENLREATGPERKVPIAKNADF